MQHAAPAENNTAKSSKTTNSTNQELLSVLSGIPTSDPAYGLWWGSEDGQWLYEEICSRIGLPLGISSGMKFGVTYEPEDIANTAVEILRSSNLHPYIHAANDPWGYLAGMLKRRLNKETGMHLRVELNEESIRTACQHTRSLSPTVTEAVNKTTQALLRCTPTGLRGALPEAVWYFAERGHVRLSHLYTTATKDPELTGLGLTRFEILAIANAVLGSRPEHGHNSILAGYLLDSSFNPTASIPHRLALRKFKARINAQAITPAAAQTNNQLVAA